VYQNPKDSPSPSLDWEVLVVPRSGKLFSFYIPPSDRRFLYYTLKSLSHSIIGDPRSTLKKRRDVIRLALKFFPGNGPLYPKWKKGVIYLQDWERHVIVGWFLKLHNLAVSRNEKDLIEKFRRVLDILK
jgi:hypothetical protein